MSEAYLAGTLKHLPQAEITFDRYHVPPEGRGHQDGDDCSHR